MNHSNGSVHAWPVTDEVTSWWLCLIILAHLQGHSTVDRLTEGKPVPPSSCLCNRDKFIIVLNIDWLFLLDELQREKNVCIFFLSDSLVNSCVLRWWRSCRSFMLAGLMTLAWTSSTSSLLDSATVPSGWGGRPLPLSARWVMLISSVTALLALNVCICISDCPCCCWEME